MKSANDRKYFATMRPRAAKVAHLTSVHPHYDVRIFHRECRRLAQAGYRTVLIAPKEQGDLLTDGVRIRPVTPSKNRGDRITRTVWQVFRAALAENADIYHFHDPELIPVGMLLKLFGRRVIYDAHENIPENILLKNYIPLAIRPIVAWMAEMTELAGAMCFDGVVAANPVIAKRLPAKKTITVQNFPISDESASVTPKPYAERPFSVVYAGIITAFRGMSEMIQAMSLLPEKLHARLILAGRFLPSELEQEAEQTPGWERTEFRGWLSRPEVLNLLADARIGLMLSHPFAGHEGQPNKIFEYMCAGIPVILSDFPSWRKIVDEVRCGLLVDPLNTKAIADAIQWLLEQPQEAEAMGLRGQQAVHSRFNWDSEGTKLVNFYRKILDDRSLDNSLAIVEP